jgi:hypothetical protein
MKMHRDLFINTVYRLFLKYLIIHKSVKHFKNSQQIDYAMNRSNSYADRERNSLSFFFTYFKDAQYAHLW